MQKFCKAFIFFCNGRAELVAVYIKIIERVQRSCSEEEPFAEAFDMVEYTLQGFVQVFIVVGFLVHITEKLRREE